MEKKIRELGASVKPEGDVEPGDPDGVQPNGPDIQ